MGTLKWNISNIFISSFVRSEKSRTSMKNLVTLVIILVALYLAYYVYTMRSIPNDGRLLLQSMAAPFDALTKENQVMSNGPADSLMPTGVVRPGSAVVDPSSSDMGGAQFQMREGLDGDVQVTGEVKKNPASQVPATDATALPNGLPVKENMVGDQKMGELSQDPALAQLRAASCFPKDQLTAQELLPQNDESNVWAQTYPTGEGSLKDKNLLQAGYHVGINTVGQTLRNANLQLRSDPPCPQQIVSPWLQSTIDPDLNRRPFEIGGC